MKLLLSASQKEARERARSFARTSLLPRVSEVEAQGYSREQLRVLGEHGFFGALVPESLGGRPLDSISWGLVKRYIYCRN